MKKGRKSMVVEGVKPVDRFVIKDIEYEVVTTNPVHSDGSISGIMREWGHSRTSKFHFYKKENGFEIPDCQQFTPLAR